MGTRSQLIAKCNDGIYREIYCHWDGDSHLEILQNHYNTQELVEELISLGSLSYLDIKAKPEQDLKHTFEQPQDGVCVAYHRDRGEDLVIHEFDSIEQSNENRKKTFTQYTYYWDGARWHKYEGEEINSTNEVAE